jgi:hypothetical protein
MVILTPTALACRPAAFVTTGTVGGTASLGEDGHTEAGESTRGSDMGELALEIAHACTAPHLRGGWCATRCGCGGQLYLAVGDHCLFCFSFWMHFCFVLQVSQPGSRTAGRMLEAVSKGGACQHAAVCWTP